MKLISLWQTESPTKQLSQSYSKYCVKYKPNSSKSLNKIHSINKYPTHYKTFWKNYSKFSMSKIYSHSILWGSHWISTPLANILEKIKWIWNYKHRMNGKVPIRINERRVHLKGVENTNSKLAKHVRDNRSIFLFEKFGLMSSENNNMKQV